MIKKFHVAMICVAEASNYCGYRYRIEDILTVMLSGMLCGLKTTESIYHWSETRRTRNFLREELSIELNLL